MARSVSNFHDLNLVHGDIKSDNFLVNVNTQEVALTDYGSAHDPTETYLQPYSFDIGDASPELLVERAADIVALGDY